MRLWKSFEKKIHGHMSRSGISKLLVRSEMYQAQAQGTGVQVKVQGPGTYSYESYLVRDLVREGTREFA